MLTDTRLPCARLLCAQTVRATTRAREAEQREAKAAQKSEAAQRKAAAARAEVSATTRMHVASTAGLRCADPTRSFARAQAWRAKQSAAAAALKAQAAAAAAQAAEAAEAAAQGDAADARAEVSASAPSIIRRASMPTQELTPPRPCCACAGGARAGDCTGSAAASCTRARPGESAMPKRMLIAKPTHSSSAETPLLLWSQAERAEERARAKASAAEAAESLAAAAQQDAVAARWKVGVRAVLFLLLWCRAVCCYARQPASVCMLARISSCCCA